MNKIELPNLYMFFGPRGAGKTYLGGRVHAELGVRFLRVEDIWLNEFKKYGFGEKYDEAGFKSSSEKIIEILKTGQDLIIEAAAWSDFYKQQIKSYEPFSNIRLVKVNAPLEMCIERSLTRNREIHVPVPDEQTPKIHAKSQELVLDWELEVFNDSESAAAKFISEFQSKFLASAQVFHGTHYLAR